jgi:Spy/CpxP family protein refolding chaperone
MKRTLRFAAAASVMLLFVLQLSAQGPGGGRGFQMTEDNIKENAKNTAESLKLSEEQAKKILDIDMDFYNKMQIERQKMMNAGGPPADVDREAMRERMMKMRDDRNARYQEVLTAEQYKQFTETQEQRRNEMRQQREQQQQNQDQQPAERPERGRGRG